MSFCFWCQFPDFSEPIFWILLICCLYGQVFREQKVPFSVSANISEPFARMLLVDNFQTITRTERSAIPTPHLGLVYVLRERLLFRAGDFSCFYGSIVKVECLHIGRASPTSPCGAPTLGAPWCPTRMLLVRIFFFVIHLNL